MIAMNDVETVVVGRDEKAADRVSQAREPC